MSNWILRFESYDDRDQYFSALPKEFSKLPFRGAVIGESEPDLILMEVDEDALPKLRLMKPKARFMPDQQHDLFSAPEAPGRDRRFLDMLAGWSEYVNRCITNYDEKSDSGVTLAQYEHEQAQVADIYQKVGQFTAKFERDLDPEEVRDLLLEHVLPLLITGR